MALEKRSHHPIQNPHLGEKKKEPIYSQVKPYTVLKASPWKTALTQTKTCSFAVLALGVTKICRPQFGHLSRYPRHIDTNPTSRTPQALVTSNVSVPSSGVCLGCKTEAGMVE